MIKLIEIYKSILDYLGLEADEGGFIFTSFNEKKAPVVIDGASLVLPLEQHLKNFDPKEKMIFHPFTENILKGESEVIQKLRSVVNIKLNCTIGMIIQNLLTLLSSPELHSRLTPEQAELLLEVKGVDEKSVLNFVTLMLNRVKTKSDCSFVSIYLKRGGTHHGKKYSRVGITNFPLYQELLDDKIDKIRIKDKETYKQILKFIFPEIDDPDNYNFGSNSPVAPYLDSLMRTSANIASRLNDILFIYKDFIEDYDSLVFSSEWLEHFENLEELIPEIRKVPTQQGNAGTIVRPEIPVATTTGFVPVQPMAQVPPGMMQQQAVNPAASGLVKTSRGAIDFRASLPNSPNVVNSIAATAPNLLPGFNPYYGGAMNPNLNPNADRQTRVPGWAQRRGSNIITNI